MTEYEARYEITSRALGYVGTQEGSTLHKFLIDQYNKIRPLPRAYEMKTTDPWCAAFVSAIAYMCDMLSIIPAECSCEEMIAGFRMMGCWYESDDYMPQLGDIIFYDWQDSGKGDDTGAADHVGIVTKVFEDSFVVTEGNYSDAVKNRELKKNARYIRGFGLPDYAAWAYRWNQANHETGEHPSSWAAAAVAWAYENGISDGLRLQQSITREEAITMIYRYHLNFGGTHK